MTWPRIPLVLAVLSLLAPSDALGGETTAEADAEARLETRQGGTPARVVVVGFADQSVGEGDVDCPATEVDLALPCVERVLYAVPDDAESDLGFASTPTGPVEHALSGRLMFQTLSDITYRTSAEPTDSSATVDAGLWQRGATRLPAGESLWRSHDLTLGRKRARATVPDSDLWLPRAARAEPICRELVFGGELSHGLAPPPTRICVDGFVSDFGTTLNQPIPGDLFRHGRPEGATGRNRGSSAGAEQLITEYLFVSGLGSSPPWSNSTTRSGSERGLFQLLRPTGASTPERFVVPPRLSAPDWTGPSWWVRKLDPQYVFRMLTAGTARFAQEIGAQVLSYGTEEYNPTHTRTMMALAAMLRPPPSREGAPPASTARGRNPGHRYSTPLPGTDTGDKSSDEPAAAARIEGSLNVQLRNLPVDLRWAWIEALLPEVISQQRLDQVLRACGSCPDRELPPEESERAEWTGWMTVIEALHRGTGFQDALNDLVTSLFPERQEQLSGGLLVALVDTLGIDHSALLFDHVVSAMSTALNSVDGWTSEDLEAQAGATWQEVLALHGYPTIPMPVQGAPPNPLAVCDGETAEDQAPYRLVTITALFEGPLAGRTGPLSGAEAWEAVYDARAQLPFVAVDAPMWTPLTVEPVFELPEGNAVFRAQWLVWSGWHLFWGVRPMQIDVDGDSRAADTIGLRSGALCSDTTLIPTHLEPTLLRASMLRGFRSTVQWNRKPGALPEPEPPADAAGAAEGGAQEAEGAATAGADALKSGEVPAFGPAAGPDFVDRDDTPAAEIRTILLDRLSRHRWLSCEDPVQVGTLHDDADADGQTEHEGDCDDSDPEFRPSTRPTLFVVVDLGQTKVREGGPARTPYVRMRWRKASGATLAISTVRPSDETSTALHVSPDHRTLERPDRWGKRTSAEFSLTGGLAWSPFLVTTHRCDPDYVGAPNASCPSPSLSQSKKHTWTELGGNGLAVNLRALATIWGAGYHRPAFDVGAELGLELRLPGYWPPGSSDPQIERIALLRPTAGVVLGVRTLSPPAMLTPRHGRPWGAASRRAELGRFPRVQLGVKTGWTVATLPIGVEGGPLLELWMGPALRRPAGRSASLTPYRPMALIGGFVRGDLTMPIGEGGARPSRLLVGGTVTIGIRGVLAWGMKKPEPPEMPDLEALKKAPEAPVPPGG